jgi:hypothetical protein
MAHTDTDQILDEFLGDTPRAAEWRALRQALRDRRRGLRGQRAGETDPAAQAALDAQIAGLTRQIGTLETEEVVARFVEDSVLASLARAPRVGDEDFEGE